MKTCEELENTIAKSSYKERSHKHLPKSTPESLCLFPHTATLATLLGSLAARTAAAARAAQASTTGKSHLTWASHFYLGCRKMATKHFWPKKYYRGLTRRKQLQRQREIKRFGAKDTSDPSAYVGFATDKGVKTRSSSYTRKWNRLFPEAKSIAERAAATGVPKDLLQESYDRGLAAWRTGHRPGATQQQWGYARVSSLLLCGKTHYSTDSDLVRKARARTSRARKWFTRCRTSKLTRGA